MFEFDVVQFTFALLWFAGSTVGTTVNVSPCFKLWFPDRFIVKPVGLTVLGMAFIVTVADLSPPPGFVTRHVITAVPLAATALTRPLPSTVATAVLLEDHAVLTGVVAPAGRKVRESVNVVPFTNDTVPEWLNVTLVTGISATTLVGTVCVAVA
jgi:hypothetical protein